MSWSHTKKNIWYQTTPDPRTGKGPSSWFVQSLDFAQPSVARHSLRVKHWVPTKIPILIVHTNFIQSCFQIGWGEGGRRLLCKSALWAKLQTRHKLWPYPEEKNWSVTFARYQQPKKTASRWQKQYIFTLQAAPYTHWVESHPGGTRSGGHATSLRRRETHLGGLLGERHYEKRAAFVLD